jgi:phosphoglycolate phosphatase-like HAD superfamily hydrolase
MKIKSLFFDFDGVIVDSVSCKTDAFRDIYYPFGEDISAKVVEHHLNNGGVSRFEKFVHYHAEFLSRSIDKNELDELCSTFSDLVLDKVSKCDEILGFTDFIQKHGNKFNKWIITGTPTTEINEILKRRQMDKLFVNAYGSPEKKTYWTEYILEKHNLRRDEVVFLGDAKADYEAAQKAGLKFILHRSEASGHFFDNKQCIEMDNFNSLWDILNKIL